MYSIEEIKKVLWNTYQEKVSKIDFVETDDKNNYVFYVYPDSESTLDEIANISEELYDTELFVITLERDKLIVKYLNESLIERNAYIKLYKIINEDIKTNEAMNKSHLVNILKQYTAYLSKNRLLSNIMFDVEIEINNFLNN